MKMNVTEKELSKLSEADSSSLVRYRKVKIALFVIAVVLIAALAAAWFMFGTQLTVAMTIKKLDEGLWSMEYKGNYGFDGFWSKAVPKGRVGKYE